MPTRNIPTRFKRGDRVIVPTGADISSARITRIHDNKAIVELPYNNGLCELPLSKLRRNGKVFIIESVGEERTFYDMSEGRLLVEFLKIIGCKPIYYFVRTRKELSFYFGKAAQSSADFIHIACHGKPTYLRLALERMSVDELVEAAGRLPGKVVYCSACLTGRGSFGKTFIESTGCRAFIAPYNEISWGDAAIISQLFYKKIFADGVQPLTAYRYVRRVYPENAGLKYFTLA